MAITPDDKKISQFPEVTPSEGMFIPLIDLDQANPALRNVRATVAAILALVPASGGTVTDFSSGNLSPLFTTSVATSTSTPALSFSLTTHSANLVFAGPAAGGAAAPAFRSLVAADIPNLASIYQPLDADLTAIAALGTTAYGRGFLTQADASAARTYIGAGTGSGTVTSVNLTAPAAGITVAGGPITTSGSITLALADDLAALEALSGTDTIYYRSGVSTWTAVTIGSNLLFTGGTLSASAPGTGTVTSFSAGNLSPIFTSNVATATTTPALTFALSNQNANLVFAGPTNGAAAAPTFRSLVAADIPDLSATYQPLNANLTSISALTTTSYGLDFLELADAAAARAYIGAGTGSGTVTSVGLTMPSGFSVGGSPVTTNGTLAVTTTLSGIVVGDGSGLITRTATGTADRISITNGSGVSGNPTFDIAATYVGQTSITTLGAIATGTWSATTIAAARGGTGQTTYAEGDLLYGNGSGTLSKLAIQTLPGYILFSGPTPSWVELGTQSVTTIAGTANEITASASVGSVTLSLPSALTFTGKTVTGGTFNGGAFNGTVGATTPSTGAFTSITAAPTSYNPGSNADAGLRTSGGFGGGLSMTDGAGIGQIWMDSSGTRMNFAVGTSSGVSGTITKFTSTGINDTPIGATTPSTGAFTSVGIDGNVTLDQFATTSGLLATTSGGNVDARLRLENGSAFSTSNVSQLDLALNTSTASRSAGTIGASFSNTTDASRTSSMIFGVADAGSLATRMTLTGTGINSTAIGSTTPAAGSFTAVTIGSTALLSSTVALSSTPGAALGTLTNAPGAGNPTKWLRINDNGTPIYIPAWVVP